MMEDCSHCQGSGTVLGKDGYHETCPVCSGTRKSNIRKEEPPSCFPASTLVCTESGWREIGDIVAGELVLACDSGGNVAFRKVSKKNVYSPSRISRVYQDGGAEMFSATKSHSIKTARGWFRVGQLKVGDEVEQVDLSGGKSYQKVEKIVHDDAIEPVYNLVVEKDYTFVVKGCLAHSFTYFRSIRVACYELERLWLSVQREVDANALS